MKKFVSKLFGLLISSVYVGFDASSVEDILLTISSILANLYIPDKSNTLFPLLKISFLNEAPPL